jgi:large subunit ribosomal protein L15
MRLPKLKGFKSPNPLKFQVVNVSRLNVFNDGDEVNMITLLEKGLISKATVPVKVLGAGKLEKKLNLKVHEVSKSAKQKVTEAGGKIL